MKKTLTVNDRNIIRINKLVEAERLIKSVEFNLNRNWWNRKTFDYDVFIAGFYSGMEYFKRIKEGHNLEDEEKKEE